LRRWKTVGKSYAINDFERSISIDEGKNQKYFIGVYLDQFREVMTDNLEYLADTCASILKK